MNTFSVDDCEASSNNKKDTEYEITKFDEGVSLVVIFSKLDSFEKAKELADKIDDMLRGNK